MDDEAVEIRIHVEQQAARAVPFLPGPAVLCVTHTRGIPKKVLVAN